MSGTLGVVTDELTEVGNQMRNVSNDVNAIFNNVKNIVREVTSNESWKSEASEQFATKFNEISQKINDDLVNLSNLGPTLMGAATDYEDAEADNAGRINNMTNI